jgi:hypothetical protein
MIVMMNREHHSFEEDVSGGAFFKYTTRKLGKE